MANTKTGKFLVMTFEMPLTGDMFKDNKLVGLASGPYEKFEKELHAVKDLPKGWALSTTTQNRRGPASTKPAAVAAPQIVEPEMPSQDGPEITAFEVGQRVQEYFRNAEPSAEEPPLPLGDGVAASTP